MLAMTADQYQVQQNPLGFYEILPKPTHEELEKFYAEHYFQVAGGGYELSYGEDDLRYFRNRMDLNARVLSRLFKSKPGDTYRFLDVGCGEGWALSFFAERGWDVTGLDFSTFGCQKFNPHCSQYLRTGDFYKQLKDMAANGEMYDVVWSLSVLEHVTDPSTLIEDFKNVLAPGGILVIQVPNDFSDIQEALLAKGHFPERTWVSPPDHLIYFNRDSLRNTMQHYGWHEAFLMGDYWIEMNVINPHSNYAQNPSVGKGAHRSRIAAENLFYELSPEKAINLYQASAEMGLGRNITGFYTKEAL